VHQAAVSPQAAQSSAIQPAEHSCNITVELAPDGVHIRAEYTGPLSSLPALVERPQKLGLVELRVR
jgi:hypothetical protein